MLTVLAWRPSDWSFLMQCISIFCGESVWGCLWGSFAVGNKMGGSCLYMTVYVFVTRSPEKDGGTPPFCLVIDE